MLTLEINCSCVLLCLCLNIQQPPPALETEFQSVVQRTAGQVGQTVQYPNQVKQTVHEQANEKSNATTAASTQ